MSGSLRIATPLVDAPERFFDPVKWQLLVTMVGTRAKALERLGWREDAVFQLYRDQSADLPGPRGATARHDQAVYRLKHELLGTFRSEIATGKLTMTAISPPSLDRRALPAEIAADLHLDFCEAKATSKDFKFVAVQIGGADGEREREPLLDQVVAWLRAVPANLGRTKKELSFGAYTQFGPDLTTRIFDAAYGQAFGRRRGRPRKAPENSAE